MNFLSHYYFELQANSSYQVCGMLLPDLVKNADKRINLYPAKNEAVFSSPTHLALLAGWKRHLQVDLIFHDHAFFHTHTQGLKELLKPLLLDSAIRPSFLAHIALELLLDYLLISHRKIDVNRLYADLDAVDERILGDFLTLAGLANPEPFLEFFARFKSSRYLLSYQKLENISYALRRICMRVWPQDFPESRLPLLTAALEAYLPHLAPDYTSIFTTIEQELM